MDVTTATFDQEVLEASKTLPVVVDFWAPWCGPCRALAPILEKVVGEHAARIKLVKVNSDENTELATTFGIRSIPNVIAFKNGRPAGQFMGALPESQVRAFVENLLPSAAAEALQRAQALFAANDFDAAERELAAQKFSDPELATRAETLKRGIAYARAGKGGPSEDDLRAKLAANAADHDARLALATLCASQRRYPEAMEELLEIIRRTKNWREGEARKQLLAIFGLAADQPELVAQFRRKLAAALH